ncbi:hypothetical protein J7L49_04805, partial [Candidatus Bathyarchaeota archaeon]|nr:hypothetical protein [Candidatus Bathyarchaeota archaeon]
KTTLKPGEGLLYTAIVKEVNLNFTYLFKCEPKPDNIKINYTIIVQLESPEKWLKTFSTDESQEIFRLSDNLNFTMRVNCTEIRGLVSELDKEIGTHTSNYNLNIKPKINVVANVTLENNVKVINSTFTPELTVTFKTEYEKGNCITIKNLNQTKTGAITKTEKIYLYGTTNQRIGSYIFTSATVTGLAVSSILYIKHKPSIKSEKAIRKLTAPYKDLIAKTVEEPPKTKTTIEVENLKDLAKIAETLARPILHATVNKEHTFYVIDNNIKYQFKIKI